MGVAVPACPDWTAKDLVAHMVGVDTDAENGDVDDDFSGTWTDKHVRERADRSIGDVLAEWEATRQRADELFASAPDALKTGMVVDASVHEQDLRLSGRTDTAGIRSTVLTVLGRA
ncbi:maleylpyruvate isomerase N-terminal domain-containing protein [Actinomycetospora flava]|uniref:Maleylpyruvate isomerase N-terminal domain-containing protein n=1 Tax=Actinomycetospora flava TaxID=3129232 RepID=A0ABU8MCG4_9PSEU